MNTVILSNWSEAEGVEGPAVESFAQSTFVPERRIENSPGEAQRTLDTDAPISQRVP
jgi:hypothetical protein